jgi:hypothetical protein
VNNDTIPPGALYVPLDPRIAVICDMAATIFTEKVVYHDDKSARHMAVEQALLLYGDIVIRLAENDR